MDKLPKTGPNRASGVRRPDCDGCLCGCGPGYGVGLQVGCDSAPVSIGAVLGTLGGYQARKRLVAAIGGQGPADRAGGGCCRGLGRVRHRCCGHGYICDRSVRCDHRWRWTGGAPAAGWLTAAGQRVAIVERKLFGGTCVNTGCIPTKTLVASAYAAQLARRGAEYGVVT